MKHSLLFKVNNQPWNKGVIVGPKPPLKLKEIWAIRIRLQLSGNVRNLALFNLAIDSKLRASDLIHLRVGDVTQGYKVARRATVMQRKTKRPVQFEISDQTQLAIRKLITHFRLTPSQFLFPSRLASSPHLSKASLRSASFGRFAGIAESNFSPIPTKPLNSASQKVGATIQTSNSIAQKVVPPAITSATEAVQASTNSYQWTTPFVK